MLSWHDDPHFNFDYQSFVVKICNKPTEWKPIVGQLFVQMCEELEFPQRHMQFWWHSE